MGSPRRPYGPDDLDEERRSRIRRRVLADLRPRRPTLGDHLVGVFAVLGAPAPHVVRTLAVLVVVASVVGSATVASADSLPDEALYPLKLASEQIRLALAQTAVDRAAVELSLAEHRLAEAQRLAEAGRGPAAIVASSAYGAHLATAAAELASIERIEPRAVALVAQLGARLADQQARAAATAVRLASDPRTAAAAVVLATVGAPRAKAGATSASERVAEVASAVNDAIAEVAEEQAREAAAASDRGTRGTKTEKEAPAKTALSRATEPPTRDAPAAAKPTLTRSPTKTEPPRARATPTRTPEPSATPKHTLTPEAKAAREAAEAAKHAAEKARKQLEKAKEGAKRTATPKPTPKR